MKRLILQQLLKWKQKENRKPLLIYGARQVGKSWIMEEFGKTQFSDFVYVNFERNDRICDLFEKTLEPSILLQGLEIETRKKISPATLVIFDEIQACPKAITALKYFCEDCPNYYIIAAGSLLGVAIHQGVSFPVGKVDALYMYPMTFIEFLEAVGENQLCDIINNRQLDLINLFHEKLTDYLRIYFYGFSIRLERINSEIS